jgi:release factor glutamine methyltransferase
MRRAGAPAPGGPASAGDEDASDAAIVARLRAAGCVFAEEEAAILLSSASSPAELAAMVDRRASGLPLEQVVGWAGLCGVRVRLEPGVFVPRHRTELLVREAAARLHPGAVVLDLCCGSGAVGAALAALVPGIELHAADIDEAAARCARRNLEPLGARVYRGDLYEPLPAGLRGRVDAIVANTPYVPTAEIELLPREARLHEPSVALDGGVDGLAAVRRVVAGAPGWLAPGGHVLTEVGEDQVVAATAVMSAHGFSPSVARCDELEATVVIGSEPAR